MGIQSISSEPPNDRDNIVFSIYQKNDTDFVIKPIWLHKLPIKHSQILIFATKKKSQNYVGF